MPLNKEDIPLLESPYFNEFRQKYNDDCIETPENFACLVTAYSTHEHVNAAFFGSQAGFRNVVASFFERAVNSLDPAVVATMLAMSLEHLQKRMKEDEAFAKEFISEAFPLISKAAQKLKTPEESETPKDEFLDSLRFLNQFMKEHS